MFIRWEVSADSGDAGIWLLETLVSNLDEPGILLFGIDGIVKSNIHWYLKRHKNLAKNRLIRLNSRDSCDHTARHNAVMQLRKNGATGIVGIYTKVPNVYEHDTPADIAYKELLKLNPPTPDGLTFFFTVTETESNGIFIEDEDGDN